MEEPFKLTVEEFEKFINYIETEKPTLSVKHGVLGKKDSYQLNQLLTFKNNVNTPNSTQDRYQTINLIYQLALNGKLFYKGSNEKGKPALIETDIMRSFQSLNLYEKYVYLQQTYWTHFDLHKMFEGEILLGSIYNLFVLLSSAKPNEKITKDIDTGINSIRCFFDGFGIFFHHLRFFGIGQIVEIPNIRSRYDDCIEAFIPNEFGIKLSNLILHQILMKNFSKIISDGNIVQMLLSRHSIKIEKPFDIFKNIFPKNLVQNTVISEEKINRSGVYTFKVSLSRNCWRKITTSHQHTLSDLHFAIQDSFEFDNDHLYAFCFNGNIRTGEAIFPIDTEEYQERNTEETTIEDLCLYKGQKFIYLFDFGDNWEFSITLEKIEKEISHPATPIEINRKGESPEQYPDWE
ncbi:MAG: plasmid pRiA4b ORF-3 family protein [Leptospiraceae bacterium]|nr:plasmid pRiA4b ORF-3 family protein [Leptospiraceae bacterium]MCP5492913.1 plasmid pRiA4b ORF-3 family protein [Leptospiraceae bacterium]